MKLEKLPFSPHPNPKLQFSWNCFQLGMLITPIIPSVGAISIVIAAFITWIKKYRTIIRRPLNWGFAALSILLIITVGFSNDKLAAFLGIFNFLPFFIFFAGLGVLIQTPAQLRQMAWITVLGSLPIVIIGFGQFFFSWGTPQGEPTFLGWTIVPGGEPAGRMSSLFMHANILAGYLMIVFILNLGLWLEAYRLRSRGANQFKIFNLFPPTSTLPFLTLTVIANFVALILTNSRNAWAIAIFACFAFAVYQGWRILVGSVTAIVSSVMLAAFAPKPIAEVFRRVVPAFFWARLNDEMYPNRPVASLRKTQWQFAWNMAQQRPWTGWGMRNFSSMYEAQMHFPLNHPHNFFLMLGAETGFPAVILFCSLLAWILIAGIQLLQKSKDMNQEDKLIFFSYLLVLMSWVLFNLVDVSLFDVRLNVFSWLVFAAICGVIYGYKQENKYVGMSKDN
jgi:O-antigen ligase